MPTKKNTPKKLTEAQLGRMLVNIYESGYINKNEAYKMSFVKGLLAGLGGVIGATIVVGMLLWALSLFDTIPLIDRIINNIEHAIQSQ